MLLTDITSSNSVSTLTISELFPVPSVISQIVSVEIEEREEIEYRTGVDGHMVSGMIYNPIPIKYTLLPTSPNIFLFDSWSEINFVSRKSYSASLIIQLPSLKKSIIFNNVILFKTKSTPNVQRTLDNQSYTLMCQKYNVVPI